MPFFSADVERKPAQLWSFAVRAKSKNFYFSFKASKFLPLSKISRFSVRFKLPPIQFRIKSEPHSSFSWKPKSLKRRLLRIFHPKHTKRVDIVVTWCARKCSVCLGLAHVWTSYIFWLIVAVSAMGMLQQLSKIVMFGTISDFICKYILPSFLGLKI